MFSKIHVLGKRKERRRKLFVDKDVSNATLTIIEVILELCWGAIYKDLIKFFVGAIMGASVGVSLELFWELFTRLL